MGGTAIKFLAAFNKDDNDFVTIKPLQALLPLRLVRLFCEAVTFRLMAVKNRLISQRYHEMTYLMNWIVVYYVKFNELKENNVYSQGIPLA